MRRTLLVLVLGVAGCAAGVGDDSAVEFGATTEAIGAPHTELRVEEGVLDRIARAMRAEGELGRWRWAVVSTDVAVEESGLSLSGLVQARRPVPAPSIAHARSEFRLGRRFERRRPRWEEVYRSFETPIHVEVANDALRFAPEESQVELESLSGKHVGTIELGPWTDFAISLAPMGLGVGGEFAVAPSDVNVTTHDGHIRIQSNIDLM